MYSISAQPVNYSLSFTYETQQIVESKMKFVLSVMINRFEFVFLHNFIERYNFETLVNRI